MEFRLPELGEGVYEAELVEWRVQPGDQVRASQALAEVMTDKATMELPAPFSGTITELGAKAGETVKVGQVILSYASSGAEAVPAPETAREPAESKPPHSSSPGTQKAPKPGRSEAAVRAASSEPRPAVKRSPESESSGTSPGNGHESAAPRVPAAPSVRRLAASLGIDLATIRGTGPGGRILLDDLTAGLKGTERPSAVSSGARLVPRRQMPSDLGTPGARLGFRGMRRKTAERTMHSVRTIPHYTYVDECDATEMVRLRNSLRDTFAQGGARLTFLPFFVRAVALALKEIPLVNSSLDEEHEEIVLHDTYHIGIATATPRGLMVPVIRNADRLSLLEIAREIERLSGEARSSQLRPDDLGGSTFTITSIGGIGGLISTPVINHPESAILGIGKVVKRPVYDAAGEIRPAEMVYLSFSFDHRIIDGAVGATFGNAVIARLQNPAPMLIGEPSTDA